MRQLLSPSYLRPVAVAGSILLALVVAAPTTALRQHPPSAPGGSVGTLATVRPGVSLQQALSVSSPASSHRRAPSFHCAAAGPVAGANCGVIGRSSTDGTGEGGSRTHTRRLRNSSWSEPLPEA